MQNFWIATKESGGAEPGPTGPYDFGQAVSIFGAEVQRNNGPVVVIMYRGEPGRKERRLGQERCDMIRLFNREGII